jgi:TolB protein
MVYRTGAVVGVALLGTIVVLVINWYKVSFISSCNGLPSQPVRSNSSNGWLAMGVKLPEPQGTLQQFAILKVSPDGKEIETLSRLPGSRDPAWSPDGNSLAFISQPASKDQWELNMMDVNGNEPAIILQSDLELATPTFSPEGKTLLVQRWLEQSGNPDHEIFSVNLQTRQSTRIPGGDTFDGNMRVSPDGKQIVFVSNRNNSDDIYVMNMDGSHVRQLTFNSSREIDSDWSPDGQWIVFASNRGSSSTQNNYNLFIMATDGTNQCQLTDATGSEWQPVWSPDGLWIAYISLLESKAYVIHPDGTGITPIEISIPIADLLSIDWQAR